jgi:hypothetical protein
LTGPVLTPLHIAIKGAGCRLNLCLGYSSSGLRRGGKNPVTANQTSQPNQSAKAGGANTIAPCLATTFAIFTGPVSGASGMGPVDGMARGGGGACDSWASVMAERIGATLNTAATAMYIAAAISQAPRSLDPGLARVSVVR